MPRITPQLRTTDMAATLDFYTGTLGFTLEFEYGGFYAGLRFGESTVHVKHVDRPDPSIPYVVDGGHLHLYITVDDVDAVAAMLRAKGVPLVQEVCETEWRTRECVIRDDQGHTLYFGEAV